MLQRNDDLSLNLIYHINAILLSVSFDRKLNISFVKCKIILSKSCNEKSVRVQTFIATALSLKGTFHRCLMRGPQKEKLETQEYV